MFSSDFKKFFTHLAVHCCEVEVEGKRRAGSPLLALSGRRVNLAALLLVLIYAAEIYESKPPKSRALRHSCSCFEAVRKLLAANQSSRVDTPRRTPPPPHTPPNPGPFRTHLRGIDPSLRRPTDSYFLRAPPPRHPIFPPPSANGCHLFSSSISVVAARTDWEAPFFFLVCVRVAASKHAGLTAAPVMENPRVCVGGSSPWLDRWETPRRPPPTPFQAASWPSSTGNSLLGS